MPATAYTRRQVLDALQRYWGFDALRPIQEQAIRAALRGRDSLVVMPTGGGKSLCYQLPPAITGRTGVVVSPLIALMKDQVDGLVLSGYPAAALHSNLDADDARRVESDLASGRIKLLFLAPERLLTPPILSRLAQLEPAFFAIDEAHCISQWGHDFRPEYRRLAELRDRFPAAAFHAFTATATEHVREDIIRQLRLRDPEVLIGVFDRPNLTYRIIPRIRPDAQVAEAVRRHASGESAGATIIYCISRKDTEGMAAALGAHGIRAEAYHAGLAAEARRRIQDDFASERLDVVVATVAFGMGIDRSNVRCVVHAAMPKSIEAYQQETGRAGRDGLPAECILLHSQADAIRWQELMRRSAFETAAGEEAIAIQRNLLERMSRFASGASCRHRALSEYFGQPYTPPGDGPGCGACDVCLGDLEPVPDSTTIAQKILSCIARTGQTFGAAHIADILRGSRARKILDRRHDELSTFGLLRDTPRPVLLGYITQLVEQGIIAKPPGEYPVLVLSEPAVAVLKGERAATLVRPKVRPGELPTRDHSAGSDQPLSAEDVQLFEALRALRITIARERNLAPFILFHDTALRAMARLRPTTLEAMARIPGIGERKLADLGPRFVALITEHCAAAALDTNRADQPFAEPRRPKGETTGSRAAFFALFDQGLSIAEAASRTGRAESTASDYLSEYVIHTRPASIARWVDDQTYHRITEAAATLAADRLKPIFEHFGGQISYAQIRLVLAHQQVKSSEAEPPPQARR